MYYDHARNNYIKRFYCIKVFITIDINYFRWANFLYSENSIGTEVEFNHPYLQADAMFVGEFLCMFAFLASSFMTGRKAKVYMISIISQSA